MDTNKEMEEANKEVEKSKTVFENTENIDSKESEEDKKNKKITEQGGSGIFTVDGKELPNIEGGYDIINPGGSLGDDDFVSV